MYTENQLVLEIFEGLCDVFLSPHQKRILMLYCGANTGHPPLSVSSIAAVLGKTISSTQQALQSALLMLPSKRLTILKSHLDAPQHKYHQGLSDAQRQSLRRLVEGALQLQQRRQAQAQAAPSPAHNPPAPASSAQSAQPSPRPPASSQGFFSVQHQLVQALEALGKPSHVANIYERADWSRGRVSQAVALDALRHNRQFLALGDDVFALASWGNRHPQHPDQLLYCPRLPVHDHLPATHYLEYVLALMEQLEQRPLTAGEIWQWASRRAVGSVRVQDIFDLHYALGLHEPVNYAQDKGHLLHPLILTGSDLGAFRLACLRALLARAPFMAQTLAAVGQGRRMSREPLAALLYEDVRDGGDLSARLRLLEAFNAVRAERDTWSLSGLGERLLAELPSAPSLLGRQPVVLIEEEDEGLGLLDF